MELLDPNQEYHVPEPRTPADALESRLGILAGQWRLTQSDEVVTEYHQAFQALSELGWQGSLDVEAELPDRLMPPGYLESLGK